MNRSEVNLDDELWNTEHIATYYRVGRRHITNRVVKQPGFPAPEIETSQRNRWWKAVAVREHARGAKA